MAHNYFAKMLALETVAHEGGEESYLVNKNHHRFATVFWPVVELAAICWNLLQWAIKRKESGSNE